MRRWNYTFLHSLTLSDEELEHDEHDRRLAEMEICERVRTTGIVAADSLWEATFGGELVSDRPAWALYNPVRGRRERAALEQRQREEQERQAEARRRAIREREQQRERDRVELERQGQDAIERWAHEQALASFRIQADRTRREVERLRQDAGVAAALAQSAKLSEAALEKLRRDALFISWNAVVMRNGWTEAQAAERWHDWLTGPPGIFG